MRNFCGKSTARWRSWKHDDACAPCVFRSAIPGIFIAGADIKAFQHPETTQAAIGAFHHCFNRIERLPKPTVAAIGGHAWGGGCEFTLACDFRLMVDDGRSPIGLPEVSLGIFPGAGGTQRLPAHRRRGPGTGHHLARPPAPPPRRWPSGWSTKCFRQTISTTRPWSTPRRLAAGRRWPGRGQSPGAAGLRGAAGGRAAGRGRGVFAIVNTDDTKEGIT